MQRQLQISFAQKRATALLPHKGLQSQKSLVLFFVSAVLRIGDRIKPDGFVVWHIGLNRDMSHPAFKTAPMPVLDIRSNAHHIAFFDDLNWLAAFLVTTFAGENEKNLASCVLMPESSRAGLKCHVSDGSVKDGIIVREHGEVGRAREEFAVRIERALFENGVNGRLLDIHSLEAARR